MVNSVDIIEYEDPAVQDLINKTAKELHKKYNKQRKINERFLKKKTPVQKVLSAFLDIFCVVLLLVGFVVCFATINTTINGYMPNFAGYTNMIISSKSMVASGYKVGDVVIIHSVDAKTLNVGDKIAFYVYPRSYINFNEEQATIIDKETTKHKYTLTLPQLFGFQSEEIKKAVDMKSDVVFHHIDSIYEDENGERWFKTYGSSNGGKLDDWWINEKYVVGIEDDGFVAHSALWLVDFAAKPYGILVLAVPALILILTLVLSFLKNVQIAKLELDCVEEKRKITDPVCVKNGVGYQMSTKTKFKILAQATDENKEEYIKLLWKKGTVPASIKKYYLRKKLLLKTNKDLLELNRECENMFKEGVKSTKIAKYYLTEKEKIENRSENIMKRLKSIDKYKDNLDDNVNISAKAKAKLKEVSNDLVEADVDKPKSVENVNLQPQAKTQKTTKSVSKSSSVKTKSATSRSKTGTTVRKTTSTRSKSNVGVKKTAGSTQTKKQTQKKKN